MPTATNNHTTTTRPSAPSRRSLFGAGAALLAGAAIATTAAHGATAEPDAKLIDLSAKILANEVETDRISDEIDLLPNDTLAERRIRNQRYENEVRSRVAEFSNLRRELAALPATTMAGFRAKAAVVQQYADCAPGFAETFQDDAMAWSLANDLLGVASVWRSDDEEGGV
jgi:hypothetical protein